MGKKRIFYRIEDACNFTISFIIFVILFSFTFVSIEYEAIKDPIWRNMIFVLTIFMGLTTCMFGYIMHKKRIIEYDKK